MPKNSFCPELHKRMMAENEEYRKGYEHAIKCAARLIPTSPFELKKLAIIFANFDQLNAKGMAYHYWELGNGLVAA